MTISRFSITRPVATTVLMLLLITFGLVSLKRLPVRELPDIEEPAISITTVYNGASAAVVETRITQIIEDAVAGIDGLRAIEGTSQDGQSRVMLEFRAERNIDAAANDVRDRVARVLGRLPDEADTPVVAKFDSSSMPVVVATIISTELSPMDLTDYVKRYLLDRFSTVDGVSMASLWGAKTKAMRVWLDRREMAARGVTAGDIEAALRSDNVEFPGGRVESAEREFTVRVQRRYHTPEDFGALVVARTTGGGLVRLRDVAEVRVEPAEMRDSFTVDGAASVGVAVFKQATGNTLTVSDGVRALIAEMKKPGNMPAGMDITIRRDEAAFISASIKEVRGTLIISGILVVLTIFLFLGNARAALIPALTVPIALVSALSVVYVMGYSINMLTLLALVLAIGMVVDDAIIIIENTHRRIAGGEKPLVAAARGAEQVFFVVVATTFVLVAVFLPIALWEGKTGRLFTEFAVTITAAVCCSTLVALTLAPMLCSKLFKEHSRESGLTRAVDNTVNAVGHAYARALRTLAKVPLLTLLIFAAVCVVMAWGWRQLAWEYEPQEDRGSINASVEAPEGTGFYAMYDYMAEAAAVFDELIESGDGGTLLAVQPGWGSRAMNGGRFMIDLKPWDSRKTTAMEWRDRLRPRMEAVPGVRIFPSLPAGIGSRGNPVQFVIGGPDYAQLLEWRNILETELHANPGGLVDWNFDYKETTPQLDVTINRERADELGVSATAIGSSLETLLGSKKATTFVERGQEYDVIMQANRESRATPSDLANIHVRARTGALVPLDSLVTLVEKGDAARLNRFNRVRAITLTGNVGPGHALGGVLDHLKKIADSKLPEFKQIGYKGQSRDLRDSTGSMYFIFALALLVSSLVLAWQFESFITPLVVAFTIPLGMIGAVAGLNLMGYTMNTYSQIGIIMLIGLAGKNGILIVEFANQLRDQGMEFSEAVFEASRLRLRPILMTGLTTVAGAVPLINATGAGAMSRRMIGTVVFYGATTACLLTLFIVPVGYLLLARWGKSPKALARKLEAMEKAAE